MDDPSAAPLVGDATIVVVNDARHQLEANFLQRTVPYFFELTGGHPTVAAGGRYRWAKVGLDQQQWTVRTAHFPCLALIPASNTFGLVFCRPAPSLACLPTSRFPLSCPYCRTLGTKMVFLCTRMAILSHINVLSVQLLEAFLLGVGTALLIITVLLVERGAWSIIN